MAPAVVPAACLSTSPGPRSNKGRYNVSTSPRSPAAEAATSSLSRRYGEDHRDAHLPACRSPFHESSYVRRLSRSLDKRTAALPHSHEQPTLLSFASSFQTLLDSQAPISSSHSACSELLSVSQSPFPPSTLPISALTDLVSSSAPPSASSSSKSSFSSVSTLTDSNMGGVGTTTAGLDLLGILAEEVNWDPQQKGAPATAQLALLGQSLQSHHEAEQKLWAGHILGSLGLIEPDGSRRNSFSTLYASDLPKAQRLAVRYTSDQQPGSSSQASKAANLTEDPLNTMTLTKRTALFYENLYERLCPGIVPRAYIYPRLGRKSHDQDPSFAALALTISLLGLLGVTLPETSPSKRKAESSVDGQLLRPFVMPCVPPDRRSKGHESGQLRIQAIHLVERILQLRLAASGGGVNFGRSPTLETVVTGFFLSLALYSLDDANHESGRPTFTEWKDASFFRFCETITLAKILGLDKVGSAATAGGAASEEVMVWSMLVRAERWWAEQKPGYVCQMETAASSSKWDAECSRKRIKSDEDEVSPTPSKRSRTFASSQSTQPLKFLVKLGFASVRESLLYRFRDQLNCWSHDCSSASCTRLSAEATVRIHDSLASLDLSSDRHLSADPILIDLARQALRAKLWIACLNHNLVSVHAQGPLRPDQPLHIALDTLDLLEDLDQLVLRPLPSDAALGEAIQEALHAIRNCVSKLPQGQFAAEMFSFEQIEASDQSESPPGASPQATEEEGAVRSNSTTITRAAQSVIDNLDRFLNRVISH